MKYITFTFSRFQTHSDGFGTETVRLGRVWEGAWCECGLEVCECRTVTGKIFHIPAFAGWVQIVRLRGGSEQNPRTRL